MKELTKTPFITAMLHKAVGTDVDLDTLHVFEVTATSTVALRGKGGTVWDKAKISPNTISQLARAINDDALPLMMDHDLRGTPYGKFFYAESIPMDNGETELRGLLYVDDSEPKILAKLNASSIDETSIQFKSEKMLCSECGFDYMEAAANDDYMPFILLACDEGHKIGENGVHVNIVGVQEAVELSLVSRGAAKNSKIIAPSDAKLGEEAQRLAAAGLDLDSFYVTASAGHSGEDEVDLKEITTKLSQLTDDKIELSAKLNAATTKAEGLESEIADKDAEITRLTEERDALQTQLNEAAEPAVTEEQATKLKAFVGKQYVALKALDGDADATAPDDMTEMVKFIDENETRLSALITPGGVTTAAGAGGNEDAEAKERVETLRAQADAYRS